MGTTLSDLPDLRPPEQLDSAITIRISNTDRQRLERAAADLDVPVGRLLRAIARRALAEAGGPEAGTTPRSRSNSPRLGKP